MTGDVVWLNKFINKGGIDSEGNVVDTPRLTGVYRLLNYLEDVDYNNLRSKFPELDIRQPEYSTYIIYDKDPVSGGVILDTENIKNPANNTGYGTGRKYVPNGHVNVILKKRYRALGKQAISGQMSIAKLHDENSNYFADAEKVENATPALLDGSMGDVWVL